MFRSYLREEPFSPAMCNSNDSSSGILVEISNINYIKGRPGHVRTVRTAGHIPRFRITNDSISTAVNNHQIPSARLSTTINFPRYCCHRCQQRARLPPSVFFQSLIFFIAIRRCLSSWCWYSPNSVRLVVRYTVVTNVYYHWQVLVKCTVALS